MFRTPQHLERKIAYYAQHKYRNTPSHPNGFQGTWQLRDHSQIPEVLRGYLQRYLGVLRLRRKPIEEINDTLNQVWQGPGSVETLLRLEYEMQQADAPVKILAADLEKAVVKQENSSPLDLEDQPISRFGQE